MGHCKFCYADFSMFTDDGELIAGVRARGLYLCCTRQVVEYLRNNRKYSDATKDRIAQECGVFWRV